MKPWKQAGVILLVIGLAVGAPVVAAFAQNSQDTNAPGMRPSDDSWTGATKPGWTPTGPQAGALATGKITELDLANGTMTLDNGEQFTLSQSLEYTSLPMIGQAVEVTFSEQNGQTVVHEIDPDDTGRSHSSGS